MPDAAPEPDPVRLQKVLAARGIASRRVCEQMIEQGRVTVNGSVATLGDRVRPDVDVVEVDGALVGLAPDRVYYLLNKPAGHVSTAVDTHDRPIVTELVPAEPRVFPVGRLDLDTEGLLLLTNDGELTHRLTHPSFGVDKEYIAELDGRPSRGDLRAWREGIDLDDGRTAPAKASLISPNVVRLTIHEGRNRQVRRMCEALGYRVTRLVRTRFGPIADRGLAPGAWRALRDDEVRSLELATAAGAKPKPSGPANRGEASR